MKNISLNFFVQNRFKLTQILPVHSLTLIFASPKYKRNKDVDFLEFKQESNFYYVSGFTDEDAIILIDKSSQKTRNYIFSHQNNPKKTIWEGEYLDASKYGFDQNLSFDDFPKILKKSIKTKQLLISNKDIKSALATLTNEEFENTQLKYEKFSDYLSPLRQIKQKEEINLLKQAADLSAKAHTELFKFLKSGLYEYQVAAKIIYEFSMHNAMVAYPPIVAGGNNACILHYTKNSQQLKAGELLLVDAGCEVFNYAGDITRVYPISGKFNPHQKELYNLVLEAQKKAISLSVEGSNLVEIHTTAIEIMTQGLIDLKIIKANFEQAMEQKLYTQFYMHGTSHWLGLDVHDDGVYYDSAKQPISLKENMLITVEPGIYIHQNTQGIEDDWKGIGIRIEDDVLIQKKQPQVLTKNVVKSVEEIEYLMNI